MNFGIQPGDAGDYSRHNVAAYVEAAENGLSTWMEAGFTAPIRMRRAATCWSGAPGSRRSSSARS